MKTESFQHQKHWFPEPDDLEMVNDVYENHLFELKSSLCNLFPAQQLFASKLQRFSKIFAAYQNIMSEKGPLIRVKLINDASVEIDFSENILDAFDAYHVLRNELLLKINSTHLFENLIQLAAQLSSLEQIFSLSWRTQLVERKDVLMSKLPDAIALRKDIVAFSSTGKSTFSELIADQSGAHVMLINELYRRNMIVTYGK
jgi:hypothetical protein